MAAHIPRPPGLPFIGHAYQFLTRPMHFLETCRDRFGGIVLLDLLGVPTYLVSAPEFVEAILVRDHKKFVKDKFTRRLGEITGQSILVSSGDRWRKHRRLLQPLFGGRATTSYFALTRQITAEKMANLRAGPLDVQKAMSELTLSVIAGSIFGSLIPGESDAVGRSVNRLMDFFLGIANTGVRPPIFLPTLSNLRAVLAKRRLRMLVGQGIQHSKKRGGGGDDLFSLMLRAQAEDPTLTDAQIRDEAITFVIAGHETTALMLTYTLYLLAKNREVLEKLQSEIDLKVAKAELSPQMLENLPYLEAVCKESMRLYPPVWTIGRECAEEFRLGDYTLPPGAQILISQWVTHRDPQYFPRPTGFEPERWLDGSTDALPSFAYFPFGGGPRVCLGMNFSMMESKIALINFLQRFHFLLLSPNEVDVKPSATLRPKQRIRLQLTERALAS